MKRTISLIIVVAMLFSFSITAFAHDEPIEINSKEAYTYIDNSYVSIPTSSEINTANLYALDYSDVYNLVNNSNITIKEAVLSVAEQETSQLIGSCQVTTYLCPELANILYNCIEITEISLLNDLLYISYETTDNYSVILCYNDDSLENMSIYNSENDSAFFLENGSYTIYNNFRNGSYYEIADEYKDEINTLVATENWDALAAFDDIYVDHDGENYYIGPVNEAIQPLANGYTNTTALLNSLKSAFPPYTNSIKLSTTKYCSALERYLTVQVKESHNSYVKKTANWKSFAATTAVTAVATFLSLPASTTVLVLTAVGVGISLADTITSAVTLYNSAVYQATDSRVGYVYDPTVYADYVRVVTYGGTTQYTGGYDSTGTFTWVISSYPSCSNYAYSTIATTSMTNYNSDITLRGACMSYYPD